jgi:hypothetical protein
MKATCLSVWAVPGKFFQALPTHKDRHCNCLGLAPRAGPPLWTGVVCCSYMDKERAASRGGGSTGEGGGRAGKDQRVHYALGSH